MSTAAAPRVGIVNGYPIYHHYRAPSGQRMNDGERATLRAILKVCGEDGWFRKTTEYLGHRTGLHRTTIARHLRRFAEWGLLVEEPRYVDRTTPWHRRRGKEKLVVLDGWRLCTDGLPKPKEKVPDLDKYRELERLLKAQAQRERDLAARIQSTVRENESLRQQNRDLRRLVDLQGRLVSPDHTVETLASTIAGLRVSFAELPERHLSGAPERVYGEPAELARLVDVGIATHVVDEPLWPVDLRGAAPVPGTTSASLEQLAEVLRRATEPEIIENLRWYRAHLFDHPDQLQWWGSLYRKGVWWDIDKRANESRGIHQRRLQILLETHVASRERDASVLLTEEPDRGMSDEATTVNRDELLAIFAEEGRMRIIEPRELGKELGNGAST